MVLDNQISLFDGNKVFKIDKPIRLISLFSGYDSQALALKYLGVKFEHYRTCEWAVKSIQALKDLHFSEDNTDYSADHSLEFVVNRLFKYGISSNYNEPMTKEQIKRMGETKCRQVYNNIKATHNLVNIQKVTASDLNIEETDKYTYIMTYSFPCQDLSKAGLGLGMEKGSGTRSGMLWEVERILEECADTSNLPQVLLMENVPDVIGTNNIKHFASWLSKLENLGYHCYWKVLNGRDYGIPQNRERCFMISVLGDYLYQFPKPISLEHKLKDLLETDVDEKYYLSDKAINGALNTNFETSKLENKIPKNGVMPTLCARDAKDPKCVIETNLKTQLCNDLIASGKVKENDVIRHSYSTSRMNDWETRGCETNNISPTLDTRCDCLGVVVNSKNKRLKNLVEKTELTEETLALDCFNQISHKDFIHTIKTNIDSSNMTAIWNNLRIRKLTPKECFRLMGVKDEDFERFAKNQSNASLYHLAGDSIIVDVLIAIFKQII